MQAILTFLGTGTSMGVPTLGCECGVCRSAVSPTGDPRNRRTRPSVLIQYAGHAVVIDTGADFHAQAIREGIRRLDAVFYTHGHADHVLGMDDLRPLTFYNADRMPLFADDATAAIIERIFAYTFHPPSSYKTTARVKMERLPADGFAEVEIFGAEFRRIPVSHGKLTISGYRFGSAAYLTDMSSIPEASLAELQGLDVLILDALRHEAHPTHSNIENSLKIVEELKPKRAYFTHMSHDLDHATTDAALPEHVRLAYDGLKVEFEIAAEPETEVGASS